MSKGAAGGLTPLILVGSLILQKLADIGPALYFPPTPCRYQPMTELSPSARAVLTAVTLTKYDVPPEGLPAFAEEMAPLIAAALHAAAHQLLAVQWKGQMPADGAQQSGINWARDALHFLANELEAQ